MKSSACLFARDGSNLHLSTQNESMSTQTDLHSKIHIFAAEKQTLPHGLKVTCCFVCSSKEPLLHDASQPSLTFDLSFEKVCASVGGRQILKDVRGFVRHGSMMAVLGPSGKTHTNYRGKPRSIFVIHQHQWWSTSCSIFVGTGKTTLLNVLAGRIANVTGTITINNQPINQQMRRRIGYVLQQDVFFNNLTVEQTLKVSAPNFSLALNWSSLQTHVNFKTDEIK